MLQLRGRSRAAVAAWSTALWSALAWPATDAAAREPRATTAAIDVAIRRDGSRATGVLESCVGDQCRFAGATIPRSELAWLGLGVEAGAAAPRVDGAGELAVLASGEVVRGAIEGISLGVVVVGGRSFERPEVRWVRLDASGTAEEPAPGAGTSGPPPPSGPDEPGPGDRPAGPGHQEPGDRPDRGEENETRPPPTRAPNPEPVKPCPADQPLGGEIEFRYAVKDRDYQRCSGRARLWFRLHAMPGPWPSPLGLVWHSDAITYRVVNEGCVDVPDRRGEICSAPPQPEVRGRVVLGEVGRFGVNLLGAPGGPVRFIPLLPELSFLTLPDEIRQGTRTPLRCVSPGGSGSGEWTFHVIGVVAAHGTADCSSCAAGICVAATPCAGTADPDQLRECHTHPDRYAVIPFTGNETQRCAIAGVEQTRTFHWQVCCGCGEPPSGPPPDFAPRPGAPERDDCEEAEALQASYAGRLRAFQEMLAQIGPQLGCARARSDEGFEGIFGASGPLGRWSVALAGLAGELAPGDLGTLLGIVAAALNVAQTGEEAHPGALVEVSTSDPAVEAFLREVVPMAKPEAIAYLAAHPGDFSGATAVFYRKLFASAATAGSAEGFRGSAKILSALSQLDDWRQSNEDLCASISRWQAWKAESERLERERGELEMGEREFREKLAAIQTRCPELTPIVVMPPPPAPWSCPTSLPEGDVPCTIPIVEGTASAALLAEGLVAPVALRSSPDAAHAPASTQPSSPLAELGALLTAAADRIEQRIVPALAPFMIGAADDLPLGFQRALLADALPELQALEEELERAVALGREIERALAQARGPRSSAAIPAAAGSDSRPAFRGAPSAGVTPRPPTPGCNQPCDRVAAGTGGPARGRLPTRSP